MIMNIEPGPLTGPPRNRSVGIDNRRRDGVPAPGRASRPLRRQPCHREPGPTTGPASFSVYSPANAGFSAARNSAAGHPSNLVPGILVSSGTGVPHSLPVSAT